MIQILKCPNCGEEVESSYDVCWNCQTKINVDEVVMEEVTDETDVKNNEKFVKVNAEKIIYAGKAIIRVFYTMLFTIILGVIGGIILLVVENDKVFSSVATWLIVIGVLSNFIVLFNIYYSGKDLKESVVQNKDE